MYITTLGRVGARPSGTLPEAWPPTLPADATRWPLALVIVTHAALTLCALTQLAHPWPA